MLRSNIVRTALLALCFTASVAGAAEAQGRRGLGNTVTVDQGGNNNAAAVLQQGQGNDAALGQVGSNNAGAIQQIGNNNDACLAQLGNNLNGSITQYGDNQSVALIQSRSGMHPVSQGVCRGQLSTGGRRISDIYRNTRAGVRPGR